MDSLAHIYRQKMISEYSAALKNISNDEYEPIVITAKYMYCLVPPPDPHFDATTLLDWVATFLSMAQGLRVLCSLKWACGIEKMDIFPLVRRDDYPFHLSTPIFLPPGLMILLEELLEPNNTGTIDYHRPILLPALYALSPLFLSLYTHGLNADFQQRIGAYPTYLSPEFPRLVKMQEPRAMVVMSWWFALLTLLPETAWWFRGVIPHVLHAVGNIVAMSGNSVLTNAIEGTFKVADLVRTMGREMAAQAVLEGWFDLALYPHIQPDLPTASPSSAVSCITTTTTSTTATSTPPTPSLKPEVLRL
jgi:hypothetical protein